MGSKSFKGKKTHQTSATSSLVNNLLNNVLPGVNNNYDIQSVENDNPNDLLAQKRSNKFKDIKKKKHVVQLINDNLKKRAFLDDINQEKIIKKQKQRLRKSIKQTNLDTKQLVDDANLQNLKKHYKEGTLSGKEHKLLKKTIKKEVMKLKQWDLDYEVKEDLKELQKDILLITDPKYAEALKRKQLKQMKNKKKLKHTSSSNASTTSSSSHIDHRVSGLTPGLAPVDMEDSDSEEEAYNNDEDELPIQFD
ncbi:hypothetical protein HANVADRAFT_3245 [Hanseniaspora valbyensis NRRL Y-1626]|uniref:Regulator of rDNA transcription 14 n=1 Tax=Hanseniaspora valbyensis NRRL Y-1626 TaxID=766949 RepID=A0A1B7TB59_9ASCO|nr:hypothetical protein HANVADRAFT_3245 [Hanseniaspora valbyensis NRRL Y-1626]